MAWTFSGGLVAAIVAASLFIAGWWIAKLHRRLSLAERRLKHVRSTIKTISARKQKLDGRFDAFDSRMDEHRRRIDTGVHALARVKQSVAIVRQRQKKAPVKLAKVRTDIDKNYEAIQRLTSRVREIESLVEGKNRTLDAKSSSSLMFDEVCSLLHSMHSRPNHTPLETINRVFYKNLKKLDQGSVASVPWLTSMNTAVLKDTRSKKDFASLANPEGPARDCHHSIIVVRYGSTEFLLDGNHRCRAWKQNEDTGPHSAYLLIVNKQAPQGLDERQSWADNAPERGIKAS
jgi:uncharacterized protein YoxC